jgi:hypothetical protein
MRIYCTVTVFVKLVMVGMMCGLIAGAILLR